MTSLKILYVGPIAPNEAVLFRSWALERLGQQIIPLDETPYTRQGSSLLRKIRFRTQMGPVVERYNRAVFEQALRHNVDVVWADKQLMLQPKTLKMLRRKGITTIDFTIDNPFGPRRDPGWRLYKKNIPLFDLQVVQRDLSVRDFLAAGARNVIKMQTTFEPTLHFAPPPDWSDKDRTREVSFIGSPYDDRALFIERLWRDFKVPVIITGGPRWRGVFLSATQDSILRFGEVYRHAYREAIWSAKINLAFITTSNQDEYAHKSFEIAGCGGFLLAERSQGHLDRFVEDEEAVFFSSVEECAEKIARYLPDESARARIAAAGHRRAVQSGYDNDAQLARVLDVLQAISDRYRERRTQ